MTQKIAFDLNPRHKYGTMNKEKNNMPHNLLKNGAAERNRTSDPVITNDVLKCKIFTFFIKIYRYYSTIVEVAKFIFSAIFGIKIPQNGIPTSQIRHNEQGEKLKFFFTRLLILPGHLAMIPGALWVLLICFLFRVEREV